MSGSALGRRIFRALGAALILLTMGVSWVVIPSEYGLGGVYSVIYYVLIPHSKTPGRDLKELGLDESCPRCVGTYAYSQGGPFEDPQFRRDFASQTSHLRLGLFLLRNPSSAYRAIRYSLDFAGIQRPRMGNFDRSSGAHEFAESQAFAFWSNFKRRIFGNWGSRYVFYFLAVSAALCALLWLRHRRLLLAGLCLCVMAVLALCIGSFADALEVTRHFFVFNALLDIMLASALIAALPKHG